MFATFSNALVEEEAFAAGVAAIQSKSAGLELLFAVMQNLLQAAEKKHHKRREFVLL